MPELIYIHIKIQQNELYLRQYFFLFFSHVSWTCRVMTATPLNH